MPTTWRNGRHAKAKSLVPQENHAAVATWLTLLGLQSRFGDNWGQITWNLSALSPKRDWSSKGVKWATCERQELIGAGHSMPGSTRITRKPINSSQLQQLATLYRRL